MDSGKRSDWKVLIVGLVLAGLTAFPGFGQAQDMMESLPPLEDELPAMEPLTGEPAGGEMPTLEPLPAEPAPVEMMPMEPMGAEPLPAEPAPVEMVPLEPAPAEAAPMADVPFEPAPLPPIETVGPGGDLPPLAGETGFGEPAPAPMAPAPVAAVAAEPEAEAPPAGVPWAGPVVLGPVTHATPAEHQVQEGEDLHLIAAYYYGNARLWRLIFEANRQKISNPNRLTAGAIITVPSPKI